MSLYYFGNARSQEQLDQMRRLEAEGICIFCPSHLAHDPNVVYRGAQWTVVPNKYPYRNTALHLLLLPNEHVTDMADLSPAAQQDLWPTLGWVRDHYALTAYGLAVRNGLTEYTGGTIRHLHLHLIQGDIDNPDHQPVRVKLTSREIDPDELNARFP